jgi:hypothetical protein
MVMVPPPGDRGFEVKTSDGDDEVSIERSGEDAYRVTINGEASVWSAQDLQRARFDLQAGNDTFIADAAVDVSLWVYGGSGDDLIVAGNGNDSLRGGGDADHLDGGAGDDVLWGGGGDDELVGGAGADQLGDVYGRNLLNGGRGDDRLLIGDDVGLAQPDRRNTLVDFDDLADSAEHGGWLNWVRPTKIAAPYDSSAWNFSNYITNVDDWFAPLAQADERHKENEELLRDRAKRKRGSDG